MEVVSPKSIASSNRIPGGSFPLSKLDTRSQSPFGLGEGHRFGLGSRGTDIGSRLENLLQGADSRAGGRGPLLRDIRSRRPLLAETEEKIFGEVIGLVDEIDELKQSIMLYEQEIRKIQIQNPDVEEQVGYHGYSQPLTAAQCNDLEEENAELIKRIQEIESRQVLDLEQILMIQKSKSEELKQQLAESTDPVAANKAAQGKIIELKKLIQEIQNERKAKVKVNYPGIQRLKSQNQQLRQKTITNLKIQKLESEEERDLLDYLKREEHNRIQFVEELKKFKAEFKRLKQQNEHLKERRGRKALNSKENSARGANEASRYSYSKTGPAEVADRSWLRVESGVRRGGQRRDKLGEYENFIKMMQDSLRQ